MAAQGKASELSAHIDEATDQACKRVTQLEGVHSTALSEAQLSVAGMMAPRPAFLASFTQERESLLKDMDGAVDRTTELLAAQQNSLDAARAAAAIILTKEGLSTIIVGVKIARCIFARLLGKQCMRGRQQRARVPSGMRLVPSSQIEQRHPEHHPSIALRRRARQRWASPRSACPSWRVGGGGRAGNAPG